MNIAIYGRVDKGGLKTHILSLIHELSKRHNVTLISQQTLGSTSFYGGLYFFDFKKTKNIFQNYLKKSDILHIHHPATSSEFNLANFNCNIPIVNTFHFSLGKKFNNWKASLLSKLNTRIINQLGKKYSHRSSAYIAVGSELCNILQKYNKTIVIHNGVNVEKFRPRKLKRYFKDFTIGYLGRLDPEKNIINLIIACKELNIPLVLAGYSKDFDYIKKKYSSPNTLFLGHLEDSQYFYNKIDLFVSPSLMEANIPLTILEAMSSGVPVISGNCGGEEKNIKESFGIITEGDKESIKANIKKVMNSDYIKMGKNARKEALNNFNLKDKVRQIETIYKKALSSS